MNQQTGSINSMVLVEKRNGYLCICIDPKDLNQALKREHFQIPTKEVILSKLAGAKWFTRMDATAGFHQIMLDEKSSLMTTFNTPFGRYCYLRLPMGICSAPEIFHKSVYQHLEDLSGVCVFMDDIIIWGSSVEEHDECLETVLRRLTKIGLRMNFDKCVFRQNELLYLGEMITQQRVRPDPSKVQAIKDMPIPQDRKDLQRALGMVTYMARFVPNLSARTAVLRALLRKDVSWQWHPEHDKAWEDVKQILSNHPVLQYYDETTPLKVSTDASKDGIGSALLQEVDGHWMPVAYASRAMTESERSYAQIEKEMLGVVYGCERFHCYTYGRTFTVETDHKPLIVILHGHPAGSRITRDSARASEIQCT